MDISSTCRADLSNNVRCQQFYLFTELAYAYF
jgi:hypothetical protein